MSTGGDGDTDTSFDGYGFEVIGLDDIEKLDCESNATSIDVVEIEERLNVEQANLVNDSETTETNPEEAIRAEDDYSDSSDVSFFPCLSGDFEPYFGIFAELLTILYLISNRTKRMESPHQTHRTLRARCRRR